MDPQATLVVLEFCVNTGEWAAAVEALNRYYQWRVKGGFEPPGGDARADKLANRLADRLEDL